MPKDEKRLHYAVLLLLPFLVFLFNRNWIFQGFGHMDPWYYFGMSINFPRYQYIVGGYSGERLTWVLPARLFVAVFSPVYGWILFHLALYWASTFSLYFLVRRFVDSRAALITAAMMAVHPFFLGANGWTYLDSGSITYFFLTLVALAGAPKARHPWIYVFLGGVLWAATAYTYLLWWVLSPCCAFFFWGTEGKLELRRCWAPAAWFASGIVFTTLCMATIHYALYGWVSHGFFYANIAAAGMNLSLKKGQMAWGQQDYSWLASGGWILFPALAFLTSVIAVVRHFLGQRMTRFQMGLVLAYGYAFLVMVYFTIRENQILQFDYYADILIPLEFLVLGVFVLAPPPALPRRMLSGVLAVGLIVSLAPLLRLTLHPPSPQSNLLVHYLGAVGVYLMDLTVRQPNILWHYVFGLIVILAVMIRRQSVTWAAAVVGLSLASFGLIPRFPASAWYAPYDGFAAVQRVADAVRAIDDNVPAGQYPVMWLNNLHPGPNTAEHRSIMCALQSHMHSMWDYPAVDPTKKYDPGTQLILITDEKNVFDTANAAATRAGMPLRLRNQVPISGKYWLTFTEVLAPPSEPRL